MILNGTIHIHIRDFVSGDGPEYENMSRLSSMCTVWKLLCVLMGSPPGPRTHFRTRSYFIALPLWFVRSGPELSKRKVFLNVIIFWFAVVKSYNVTLKVVQYKQSIFIYQNFKFSY